MDQEELKAAIVGILWQHQSFWLIEEVAEEIGEPVDAVTEAWNELDDAGILDDVRDSFEEEVVE